MAIPDVGLDCHKFLDKSFTSMGKLFNNHLNMMEACQYEFIIDALMIRGIEFPFSVDTTVDLLSLFVCFLGFFFFAT